MAPLPVDPKLALTELKKFAANAPTSQVQAAVGLWAAYFGDADWALTLLTMPSLENNNAEFRRFWRPVTKNVRVLTGFRNVVRDLGIADYWRQNGWPDLCHPVGSDDFECQ